MNEIAQILKSASLCFKQKLIKQQTQDFKEIGQSRKFYRAEELLRIQNYQSMTFITAVGYENNSYFLKDLKQNIKMTLTAYRKK